MTSMRLDDRTAMCDATEPSRAGMGTERGAFRGLVPMVEAVARYHERRGELDEEVEGDPDVAVDVGRDMVEEDADRAERVLHEPHRSACTP